MYCALAARWSQVGVHVVHIVVPWRMEGGVCDLRADAIVRVLCAMRTAVLPQYVPYRYFFHRRSRPSPHATKPKAGWRLLGAMGRKLEDAFFKE